MAQPIEFTPTPVDTSGAARAELETLIRTLHEHGVLRLANDLVVTNTEWLQILANGLGKPGTGRAIQNIAVFAMLLSRIDPTQLYKLLSALHGSLESVASSAPDGTHRAAPGILGLYRLLKDETLWRALAPVIEAIRVFGKGLDAQAESPISAFTATAGFAAPPPHA